jgi:hypothetical protein
MLLLVEEKNSDPLILLQKPLFVKKKKNVCKTFSRARQVLGEDSPKKLKAIV